MIERLMMHILESNKKPDYLKRKCNEYLDKKFDIKFGKGTSQKLKELVDYGVELQTHEPYLSGALLAANSVIISRGERSGFRNLDDREKTLNAVRNKVWKTLKGSDSPFLVADLAAAYRVLTGTHCCEEAYGKRMEKDLGDVVRRWIGNKEYGRAARHAANFSLIFNEKYYEKIWSEVEKKEMIQATENEMKESVKNLGKILSTPYFLSQSARAATIIILDAFEIDTEWSVVGGKVQGRVQII